MMKSFAKQLKMAVVISIAGLFAIGCATTTGKSARFYDDYRFVPSIHIEDNSFGPSDTLEFWGCSYDQYYAGYWCPK